MGLAGAPTLAGGCALVALPRSGSTGRAPAASIGASGPDGLCRVVDGNDVVCHTQVTFNAQDPMNFRLRLFEANSMLRLDEDANLESSEGPEFDAIDHAGSAQEKPLE
jgi:hypothetical protein